MNDEIKEILNYLIKFINDKEEITKYGCEISIKQAKQLLDYITNLQQELEEYKDTETYSKRFLYKANKDRLNANLELVKELEDYKSRCEKAVEYINYYGTTPEENDDTTCRHILKSLLNILNGKGSDE